MIVIHTARRAVQRAHGQTRWRLAAIAASALAIESALPQRAEAYSDFRSFAYPSSSGGGGGRFYTGSPADGYTCRICHAGGAAPEVRVMGLPLNGYTPGLEYEVTVDWWDGDALSSALELTDDEGRPAGRLRLPPEASLDVAERCGQDADDVLAGTLVTVPPPQHRSELDYFARCTGSESPEECRQVISVPACGSGRVRFAWQAPAWDVGPVWFSGAVVSSNNDSNTTGDGVAEIGTRLGSAAETDSAVRTYAGCALTPQRSSSKLASMFSFGAAVLLLVLRRRR